MIYDLYWLLCYREKNQGNLYIMEIVHAYTKIFPGD